MDRFPDGGLPRWEIRQSDAIEAKLEYYRTCRNRQGRKTR